MKITSKKLRSLIRESLVKILKEQDFSHASNFNKFKSDFVELARLLIKELSLYKELRDLSESDLVTAASMYDHLEERGYDPDSFDILNLDSNLELIESVLDQLLTEFGGSESIEAIESDPELVVDPAGVIIGDGEHSKEVLKSLSGQLSMIYLSGGADTQIPSAFGALISNPLLSDDSEELEKVSDLK
jgi:hypothetical protein